MKGITCAMMIVAGALVAGRVTADSRTYDDLGGVSVPDASFWDVSGHAGVSVSEKAADAAALELRSRTVNRSADFMICTTKKRFLVILFR